MVQTYSPTVANRPRWIQRQAALPFLSEPVLTQVRPQVAEASILLNDQICFREIELEEPLEGEIRYPWVLIDDSHHKGTVLSFRTETNQHHLETCLRHPEIVRYPDHGSSLIARWNLVVTQVKITPVESFWHDVIAMASICLNQEIDLNGIRIQNDGTIGWPNAIQIVDPSLKQMIESAILRQIIA